MVAEYDVAITGGGPAGSTAAALLRRYTKASVLVLERERFPREHVGESQLPPIGSVLEEMGVWEEVDAAGFPIKIGATLRWGKDEKLWDFDFLPGGDLKHAERPEPYDGQRKQTAFQVDRATYDDILLRRAEALGAEVRQETKVAEVLRDGDRVTGLRLDDKSEVRAKWYVDASGGPGVLRRAMGVGVECPAALKNVAAWDYWDDAEWAETIGNGGTRVQVLSIAFGWIWFIPVSPTRASVGLVASAQYYKESGRSFEELYAEALEQEPRVRGLLSKARQRGELHTTKDWSFLADRAAGENWFLVGESVGFADPILAAGMTLAQTGARELAYTLRSLLEGEHDVDWLKKHYEDNQRTRIWQHIRFADFWYAANGQFTDLHEQCRAIAADAGLTMTAEEAWRWLAQGGFANDFLGQAAVGGYDLASTKEAMQRFFGTDADWKMNAFNFVQLDLATAKRVQVPYYSQGKVQSITAFERGGRRLLIVGVIGLVAQLVEKYPHTTALFEAAKARLEPLVGNAVPYHVAQALELLISEGWAVGTADPSKTFVKVTAPKGTNLRTR